MLKPLVHQGQEFRLKIVGGKSPADDARTVVDMVFGPETESGFQKSQPGIGVVTLGEAAVELLVEPLQLFAAPVRELGITAFALPVVGFVAGPGFDVIRHGAGVSGVGIAEAHDHLVPTACRLLQQPVHRGPVIHVLLLADVTVKHIGKLQGHPTLPDGRGVSPDNDSGHRLRGDDLAVERNSLVVFRDEWLLLLGTLVAGEDRKKDKECSPAAE